MKNKSLSFLKIKGFYHILRQDPLFVVKAIVRRPFLYFFRFLSFFKAKRTPIRDQAYLYGFKEVKDFKKKLTSKDTLLILGISYCQRPKNCPAIRFSNMCPIKHDICSICPYFSFAQLPRKDDSFIMIATALDLGKKIIQMQRKYPKKEILFAVSVCELSQEIYALFSHILGVKGIAFSLNGPTCSNFRSFQFAEKGQKKAITYTDISQNQHLKELLDLRKNTT